MINRLFTKENIGLILSTTRTQQNKSQKFMADKLGVSLPTIKNWESGTSCPDVSMLMDWFIILKINPLRYALEMINPELYKGLTSDNSDEEIREALMYYITNVMSNAEVRKLAFCIFGNTGSSWNAQLDLLTAMNHTPMFSRTYTAWSALYGFTTARATGTLVNTDNVMPNIERLEHAISCAQNSVHNKLESYYENKLDED